MSSRLRVATGRSRILALAVLAYAAPAQAAGGEGVAPMELVWQAINLALLVAAIVYLARKPVRRFFDERREQIRGDVEGASSLLERAEERYASWEQRLAALDRELEEIRATARQRAEEERDHILADAHTAAERIRRDARASIEQELRRAQAELRDEAADLSIELATKLLQDKVGEADRDRLIDEFISQVERVSSRNGSGG
jgi:F-type H+-transporting ATPase subunit b